MNKKPSFPWISIDKAKAFVLDYPEAPEGLELFRWSRVPLRGEGPRRQVVLIDAFKMFGKLPPLDSPVEINTAVVDPIVSDQHAGIPFFIGWNEEHRIAVLWS